MSKKIRVGIIFGGKSAEHEVALQSAKNVIEAIDTSKYELVLIGIDKKGKWHLNSKANYLLHENDPKRIALNLAQATEIVAVPKEGRTQLIAVNNGELHEELDVVFPILHGPFGEDGTIQGMLKLMDIPFVGAGVLGSAVGMDKDFSKRLLRDAQIAIARFRAFRKDQRAEIDFGELERELGLPFFLKPANLGSSVGIHKIHSRGELDAALDDAFDYDLKILIEEFIQGREIECAVLGNQFPLASLPGEVIPQHEFYSYEAKYIDENGALLAVPATLTDAQIKSVQEIARKVYLVLGCQGMARVDFFLKKDGQFIVNEINTIPGFTKISMYPKMWEVSGISYSELIDKLIQLGLARYEEEKKLKISYEMKS
jgi:D-alanine-D-alanine ligase